MSDVPSHERGADWPTCPGCGRRRSTACPFCHTAGTEFKSARTDYGELFDPPAAGGGSGGCCGADGCGCGHGQVETESGPAAEESAGEASALLLCPTCDEPFEPVYLGRCEGCGHEFPDGCEPPDPNGPESRDPLNLRIVVVIAAILGLTAGLAIYFGRLF